MDFDFDIEAARKSFKVRLRRQREAREQLRTRALAAARTIAPEVIARYPSVQAAYLFGSIVRPGAFRKDSDIDIAVSGVSAEEYFALWHALEDALPDWFIDLRDLPPGEHFTERVLATGEKIYG